MKHTLANNMASKECSSLLIKIYQQLFELDEYNKV